MIVQDSFNSYIQKAKEDNLSARALWDLDIVFQSLGRRGELAIQLIEEIQDFIQDGSNFDQSELPGVLDFVEQLLTAKFDDANIHELSEWSMQVLQGKDQIKDIACIVVVRLHLSTDLFLYCIRYMLNSSLSTWDRLIKDIAKHPHLHSAVPELEAQFNKGQMEVRIRIYELALPSDLVWSQFLSDLAKIRNEDPVLFATCLQSFHDACCRNPRVMLEMLERHDILDTLKRNAMPEDHSILELIAKLPSTIPHARSPDFINKVVGWFQTKQISELQCFELLAALNQQFMCPDALQQSLVSHIQCSVTEERIAAVIAASLVASTWPFDVLRDACRRVFQLATQPFLDYRLASHRFFENLATANIDLLYKCLPAFTEYLLNSSTEHEIMGLQSKWALLERVAKLSDSEKIKQVFEEGFSLYAAGKAKVPVAANSAIPRVADQSM